VILFLYKLSFINEGQFINYINYIDPIEQSTNYNDCKYGKLIQVNYFIKFILYLYYCVIYSNFESLLILGI